MYCKRIDHMWLAVVLCVGAVVLMAGCETTYRRVEYSNVEQMIQAGYPNTQIDLSSPLLKERKIVLTTDLNSLSAREVISQLLYLDTTDPGEPIDFYVNTNGGDLDACLAIIQTYRQLKSPVNTHAMVDVKSGGVLLIAAGTGKRYAYPNSLFTIHGGIASSGTPEDYKMKALAIYEREMMMTMRLPVEWYPLMGQVFHTMTAPQALQYKVVDEIAKPVQRSNER
ncbi:ATP-dependent Clp protease proteolytic subunit [Planctomycetota bacterium]|nr:ATP-dependent Clp protease proteolytic subunit [Planctomycetota bacterium]